MDNGSEIVRVTRATPVLPPGVTDDTPDFNREMVMLDISDKLYAQSASLALDSSKVFGSLIMVSNEFDRKTEKKSENLFQLHLNKQNTARRFAAFVQYFKPLLQKSLTVKGLYPPPPSPPTITAKQKTTTTTTTESNDVWSIFLNSMLLHLYIIY